jgi:hypothetical protein
MVKKSVAMVYPMSLAETPSGLGKGPVWVSSSLPPVRRWFFRCIAVADFADGYALFGRQQCQYL